MKHVELHAITPAGPRALTLPVDAQDIHALFDDLPVGVYTSLRTYGHNKFLHLADHLNRLEESLALLGMAYRLDHGRLRAGLHQVCSDYREADARVRLDVLARPLSVAGYQVRELIGLFPFEPVPAALYQTGVRVGLAGDLSRDEPRAKQATFVSERRAVFDDPGFYEYLMLDRDGYILEGTTSNFYGFKDGVMWTAGAGVLEGVARRIVLMLVEQLGLPLRLEAVPVDDLGKLDEAALSSSSRAVVPIISVGSQAIGDGRPGPIARRLLLAYNEYVAGAIKPAIE